MSLIKNFIAILLFALLSYCNFFVSTLYSADESSSDASTSSPSSPPSQPSSPPLDDFSAGEGVDLGVKSPTNSNNSPSSTAGTDIVSDNASPKQSESENENKEISDSISSPVKKNSVSQNSEKNQNSKFNNESSNLEDIDMSSVESQDDLSSLKNDLGVNLDYLDEDLFEDKNIGKDGKRKISIKSKMGKIDDESTIKLGKESKDKKNKDKKDAQLSEIENDESSNVSQAKIKSSSDDDKFSVSVGKAEKELLDVAKRLENKIPEKEWSELAAQAKTDKYVVADGDNLWNISKKLFGSGFYYAKVWSLNAYITNPHEIKPDMSLVFDTGDSTVMPKVKVGSFSGEDDTEGSGNDTGIKNKVVDDGDTMGSGGVEKNNISDKSSDKAISNLDTLNSDFNNFGDEVEPNWIKERKELKSRGVYFQYATEKTYSDIKKASSVHLTKEYDKYEPPSQNLLIEGTKDSYDESGFSKDSKISFNFKEGFATTTFVTSNLVNDLGAIEASKSTANFVAKHDTVFIRFNPNVRIAAGDKFSIYAPMGKVSFDKSDRVGYKYAIAGEVQLNRKISDLWEATVTDSNGVIQRGSRITTHTPRIKKVIKTFNNRNVEALLVSGFSELQSAYSYGDIVYLDRGRVDGVEMGNVFETFDFEDRLTGKKITKDPTYKVGELTVITLTDNFATCLVTFSADAIQPGSLAISRTKASAALAFTLKKQKNKMDIKKIERKGLEELDVELNLEDVDKKLLEKADKIELTEDELEELERQEREKSFVQKGEKDLRELERLEKDIESAEAQLNAAKVDEDKFLQDQNMNDIEKRTKTRQKDIFESLNDIEKKVGKKYMDEDLNSKENPYGLTNFDLEEVDELLNTKSDRAKSLKASSQIPSGNKKSESSSSDNTEGLSNGSNDKVDSPTKNKEEDGQSAEDNNK
ncbi:MAG: LysM peptidoglycan-binding domain-containing protein [Oligoflexia bacterium]|nr:LysM peptidoglycan-binding domain-containing protein [Oligoflexia bacterium]